MSVDPDTGKTLKVDLQLLPYNSHDIGTNKTWIVEYMHKVGVVTTGLWKAYPEPVKADVNHSYNFHDPDSGTDTIDGEVFFTS